MEYLNSIDDKLRTIDDSDYEYIDIFENPHFIYGTIDFLGFKTNFFKVPSGFQKKSKKQDGITVCDRDNLFSVSCGYRLRFFTDSDKVIFKVKLKPGFVYHEMDESTLSFDVYNIIGENYEPVCIFAPKYGFNVFSETVRTPDNGRICVFLPSFHVIQEFKLGIEKDSNFLEMDFYPIEKRLPIIFYGNPTIWRNSTSSNGNTLPNIVSKKLNQDVINLPSLPTNYRNSLNMVDLIGKINCSVIIIDYAQNMASQKDFEEIYETVYRRIRFFHPLEKIILMTSSNLNRERSYNPHDSIIIKTFLNAVKRGENTGLLNQKKLFEEDEFNHVTIDGYHYTDYGIFKIADEIINILNNLNSIESNDYMEFYDNATRKNKCEGWFDNSGNIHVFTDDFGTVLSNNTDITALYFANGINEKVSWSNSFKWEVPFILDVEILEYYNECSFRIAENSGWEQDIFFKDLGLTKNNHITIINDGLSFEVYCDGVHFPDASIKRRSSLCQCGFRIVNGSLKYKNFIIR